MTRRIKKTPFKATSVVNNCTFGPFNKPVAVVKPGEVIEVETWDCFGEICGTAIGIPSIVTIKVDLIKEKNMDWPRVESPSEIMTVCSEKKLGRG